jgi:hypothetical protein
MTRYETAGFLSKIAELSDNYAETDRLLSELKTELQSAKYEIENPEILKIGGSFRERIGFNASRMDYRLKLVGARSFGPNRALKITMDTMDSGELAGKLLDIEGKMKFGAISFKAAAGPGPVIHYETDGLVPSEDYTVYQRPKFNASLSQAFGAVDISAAYVSRNVQPWGEAGVNEFTVTGAYSYKALPLLGKTRVAFTPRYLWAGSLRDMRVEVQLDSKLLPGLSSQFIYGIGNNEADRGIYLKGLLNYSTPDTGLTLTAHKVGSDYRSAIDKYEFIALSNFNKYILDGSVDVGIELSQKINSRLSAKFTADTVLTYDLNYGAAYPGTSQTMEFSVGNELINFFYRTYYVPSGISSTDPAIARAVATSSDLTGVYLTLSF